MTPAEMAVAAESASLRYPLLIKPNSGGFGAGITRVESAVGLTAAALHGAAGGDRDGLAVLQQYAEPVDGFVYRAWFIGGRVQCGVRVRVANEQQQQQQQQQQPASFNTCVCSNPHEQWDPPPEVARRVEAMLHLSGADCGSVELLYDEGGGGGGALFFDFNCLSTLPHEAAYVQLADYVLKRRVLGVV